MSEDEQILRVTAVHPSGRRTFDPLSKRRFVAACLAPGASVAQMSLDHGVNANLVWNWVRKYSKDGVMKWTPPACLPQQSPFVAVRTEPLRYRYGQDREIFLITRDNVISWISTKTRSMKPCWHFCG